jgi:hypothetical protein
VFAVARLCAPAASIALVLVGLLLRAEAQNFTGIYSPVHLNSALPYRLELRPYSLGKSAVPTLHSYAVGEYDGKFLFISGRTNGLHGFDDDSNLPDTNFPPQYQNRDVWVIDFANRVTWRRSLDESQLTEAQILSLSATNNQFHQSQDNLYIAGGYGLFENGNFGTFDALSSIDLPGLMGWVMTGSGDATDHIRQIHDPVFRVTGGAMRDINGRTHLVFGQDFQGAYNPHAEGLYTRQVRSFDIVDDGVNLAVQNVTMTTPDEYYKRRDLNVFPVIRPDGAGGLDEGLTVLAGVFTPAGDAWSVPVEIDENGQPSMDDPADPATFQQGMNAYHSAKLGLFSELSGEMHEVLFGGITFQYLNPTTQTIEEDFELPFVNDITSVVVDANGEYSQHHLGFFPELFDSQNRRLRFGTNAEFLAAEGVPLFDNGVIQLGELRGATSLGYIFGGIVANAPHTRVNPGELSAASNYVFEVVVFTIPEPATAALVALGCAMSLATCRLRQTANCRMPRCRTGVACLSTTRETGLYGVPHPHMLG